MGNGVIKKKDPAHLHHIRVEKILQKRAVLSDFVTVEFQSQEGFQESPWCSLVGEVGEKI